MDQRLDEFDLSQPVPLTPAEAAALAQTRAFGVPDNRLRRRGGKRMGAIMVVRPAGEEDAAPEAQAVVPAAEEPAPATVAFLPEPPVLAPVPRVVPVADAGVPPFLTNASRQAPPALPVAGIGEAVAAAVAAALTAQADVQAKLHEAEVRADGLAKRVAELEGEREQILADSDARAANIAAERDRLADALADRVAAHEADREGLVADLRDERERGLSTLAEGLCDGLSEILTARLLGALDDRLDHRLDERLAGMIEAQVSGALDSHTALAERFATASAQAGALEARVAHLTAQVDTARGWRERFGDLDELAKPRPWWKFW